MDHLEKKKLTVEQDLAIQVLGGFIVVGVLLCAAGFLVFNIMSKEYTRFTVVGFIAVTYLSFITFQPAGTLFAARKDLIEGKVALAPGNRYRIKKKVVSPWRQTLPVSLGAAACCTAIVAAVIYGTGWRPSAAETVLIACLFVVPHYLIARRYIGDDLATINAIGLGSGPPVSSRRHHFWTVYVLPNLVFQSIISLSIANRAFSQEMLRLAGQGSEYAGMVPVLAVGISLAVTFILVCNFTFLASIMYVVSDMFLGKFTYEGDTRTIHGFFCFTGIVLAGLAIGAFYALVLQAFGVGHIFFSHAMFSQVVLIFASVSLGSRLAIGWTGKRFNLAMAKVFS